MIRVLQIEDNPDDAALTQRVLDDREFTLETVPRLSRAIERLDADHFDVALLDMSLPDSVGAESVRRIVEARPNLPIVVLSGDDSEATAMAAVHAGAQDYLLKGHVDGLTLRRALHYAIERQELTARLAASVEELERQRSSVLQLNQLKNDLIAVLAHDIKGPLTSIVGFAELLEDGYLEGDAATDAARTIRVNAQRLATLANDVLALSRVEHGELEIADERVDLVDLLQNLIQGDTSGRTITFTHDVDEALVRGDTDRLRQVFDNLVRNAIKYSPGVEPVDVALTREGESYRVDVRDHGIGVPPEELPKLFERFTRGSNARRQKISGTGIGLFIVRMIVERHGGQVGAASSLGEGSTFSVFLPTLESSFSQGPMRVVLITDDADLRRFAAYELRTRGYRVRECKTFDECASGEALRGGDVIVAEQEHVTPEMLKPLVPGGVDVRLVGIVEGESLKGWDAVLRKPFLAAELVDTVAGENVHGHFVRH